MKGVADTLFIPLTARIYVSKRFPEYFYDQMALSLQEHLPDDKIEKTSTEYMMMASVARYYNLDQMTRDFISRAAGPCNIINLGAGLETAYFRIKSETAVFYEIDLPEVIAGRRQVLGEQAREVLTGGDLFRPQEWAQGINTAWPSLLIVSGVFQYFHKTDILRLIGELKALFPRGELIFDAANQTGLRYANRYVKRTGNASAEMYFYVNSGHQFGEEAKVRLIDERPFFTAARQQLKHKLRLFTRIAMAVTDYTGRARIFHYRLG